MPRRAAPHGTGPHAAAPSRRARVVSDPRGKTLSVHGETPHRIQLAPRAVTAPCAACVPRSTSPPSGRRGRRSRRSATASSPTRCSSPPRPSRPCPPPPTRRRDRRTSDNTWSPKAGRSPTATAGWRRPGLRTEHDLQPELLRPGRWPPPVRRVGSYVQLLFHKLCTAEIENRRDKSGNTARSQ